jgi:hypothetical protein
MGKAALREDGKHFAADRASGADNGKSGGGHGKEQVKMKGISRMNSLRTQQVRSFAEPPGGIAVCDPYRCKRQVVRLRNTPLHSSSDQAHSGDNYRLEQSSDWRGSI